MVCILSADESSDDTDHVKDFKTELNCNDERVRNVLGNRIYIYNLPLQKMMIKILKLSNLTE